ncbi:rhodanese-like domain-containing protein [Phaeodactylibacter luteus]|uniref:Rhodanese-like domain-containing protein n=2 Tax=Phaeodactylibacter luteus TaxID=1564516 RepID=A0A5C6RMP2_9BACT|nr:rhodanese-like domain-containing protein [Phaeodactylibacter luteus]
MAALGEVQLLDVRTPEEYGAGHIEGATLINFFDADFVERTAAAFDKEKPLMLYCRSGNRSAKATAKLKAAGFKEIIDLKGGYNAWPKQ